MRVLYVDDHERFRAIVTREFLAEHEIIAASTLAQARELLQNETFDAVLLDYDLPDGKGAELIDALRERGLLPRTVAVSSFEANNALLLQAGAATAVGKLRMSGIGEVLRSLVS